MTPPDAPEPRTVAEHGGEGEDTQAEVEPDDVRTEQNQSR